MEEKGKTCQEASQNDKNTENKTEKYLNAMILLGSNDNPKKFLVVTNGELMIFYDDENIAFLKEKGLPMEIEFVYGALNPNLL